MFGKLAAGNADDVDNAKGYAFAGWWDAHELALLGACLNRYERRPGRGRASGVITLKLAWPKGGAAAPQSLIVLGQL